MITSIINTKININCKSALLKKHQMEIRKAQNFFSVGIRAPPPADVESLDAALPARPKIHEIYAG